MLRQTHKLFLVSAVLIGTAAAFISWTNAIYISVMVATISLLLLKQAATTQRASNLESAGKFTAQLVGVRSTDEVIDVSLRGAAATMRSSHAAIVMRTSQGDRTLVYRLDSDDIVDSDDNHFLDRFDKLTEAALLSELTDPELQLLNGMMAPLCVGGEQGLFVVWERSTNVDKFAKANLVMYQALVDQVEVALDRAELIDQLHHDAHHDGLTKLPNRLGFAEAVNAADGALLMLDLDRFKDINDTLGHSTGDRALEIIAERLVTVAGDSVVLGRLGGDEFAVFDPSCQNVHQAALLAKRLINAIEQPIGFADISLQVGASIGVALAPVNGSDLTILMKCADSAMYRAKHGQLGWEFYHPQDDKNAPRRLELLSALSDAIDARELEVWYQPKLNVDDRQIVGAEALARWNHSRYGQIPADEFIELAESSGLMRKLTDAILERVTADMKHWDASGTGLPVAVNLSARNLLDRSLPQRVANLLDLRGVDPGLLSFEITETAIMFDRDRVAALLREFSALGIGLAIDDFGTGYSSLAQLRELPLNDLKIDCSVVRDLDLDADNEVIVRSTINLAHSLGLTVVAEGVERESEAAVLETLGCDFVQGFLYSRPMSRGRFDVWRASQTSKNFESPLPALRAVVPASQPDDPNWVRAG